MAAPVDKRDAWLGLCRHTGGDGLGLLQGQKVGGFGIVRRTSQREQSKRWLWMI